MSVRNCAIGLKRLGYLEISVHRDRSRDSMLHLPLVRRKCRYRFLSYQTKTVSTFCSGEKTITAFDFNSAQSNRQMMGKTCPKFKRLSERLWECNVLKIVPMFWNALSYSLFLHDPSYLLAFFLLNIRENAELLQ